MKKSKNTKRTLITCVLAMIMCAAMLIGTTFAWFTDTASTKVNKIKAGTLEVELWNATKDEALGTDPLKWVKAEDGKLQEVLWEPGATYNLESFRIKNNGELALKYKVAISGITGNAELLDAIDFTVKVGNQTVELDKLEGNLEANAVTDVITISGTMKDVGNAYQGLSIDGISITVIATQDTVEYDSKDNKYDQDATYLNTDAQGNILIGSEGDLRYFASVLNADNGAYAGKSIKLTSDIDLNGAEWTPIMMKGSNGSLVTFDGQGHTISNFKVNAAEGKRYSGLFGIANYSVIKNLNVDNATVTGYGHVAALVGHGMVVTIEGCKVTKSNVTAKVWWDPAENKGKGGYNDGDKVGALLGWADEGINSITGCTVEDCSVTGYRDIAGLAGYVGTEGGQNQVVTGNTVKDTTVTQDLTNGYETMQPVTLGEVVGRGYIPAEESNTVENVTITPGS